MDFAGYSYYKPHCILLSLIGLWIYDSSLANWPLRIFCALLLASGLFIELAVYFTNPFNLEQLLRSLPYIYISFLFNVKYHTFYLSLKTVKMFFERVRNDWKELKTEEEYKIIHKYTYAGKVLTILFLVSVCLTTIISILSPLFLYLLDHIVPLNESRVFMLPMATEYFFDEEKYFTIILLHFDLNIIIGSITVVGTEVILFMFVHHICAMFSIVSYRVDCAMNKDHSLTCEVKRSSTYLKLIEAVELHKKAIESVFAELLISSFSITYSVLLLLGVLAVSLNLYRLSQARLLKNDMEQLLIIVALLVTQFSYVYVGNYACQLIINHSEEVYRNAYDTKWYEAPLNAQKALLIIMVRSMDSCNLILLGMYMPCLEGFATVSSVSFSYFTMLYSTQTK